jgi:hypothetical protein
MSLPFNSCLIPRYILDSLDSYDFSYALAWHVMMPLFMPTVCSCGQTWDPLGLHAASCLHLNAYCLLHNAVRDCFAGAARKSIGADAHSRVSYILTDKHAKSATWMHEFYPLRPTAPSIPLQHGLQRSSAPSLSPDILIAFVDDPLNPYFGDFVASSPSASNKLQHGQAAQAKYVQKLQHYSAHHVYPPRVCYPLAFERSGYLHPTFDEFIDLFSRCSSTQPQPHTALQLRFSVSFAITFTTAALIRAASHRLLPRSLRAFVPPKPLSVPTCWAPTIPPHFLRALPTNPNAPLFPQPFSPVTSHTALSADTCPPAPSAQLSTTRPSVHPALMGAYSPENSLVGALDSRA